MDLPDTRSLPMQLDPSDEPKTVAIFSKTMPYPGPRGYLQYMYAFVQFLESRGHRVEIVLPTPDVPFVFSKLRPIFPSGRVRIHAPHVYRLGRWHFVIHPTRVAKNVLSKLLALFPGVGAIIKGHLLGLLGKTRHAIDDKTGDKIIFNRPESNYSEAGIVFATAKLRKIEPAAVFFDTIYTARCAAKVSISGTKYVITHDVHHERHATQIARGYEIRPHPLSADDESRMLMNFDTIVAIQPQEAETFRKMCPDREVLTIPFPVTLFDHDVGSEASGRCLFAGSAALPNVDGLNWFLSEIWPSVVSRVPHAKLHVCGPVCEEVRTPLTGVVYRGIVPDLGQEYNEAALAVIPLKTGSGLKIKTIEALSRGLPCVTTTIGAQGLNREGDLPYVVADTPEKFADLVVDLVSSDDNRKRLNVAIPALCSQFTATHVFTPLVDKGL